jgi:hypothetical protein
MTRDADSQRDDPVVEPTDARRVAAYLEGDDAVFHEVHSWIRREI